MSATLADQTLTLNTLTTIPMDQYPLAYVDWIVLINASPFALQANFGGNQFHVPAWYYYPVDVRGKAPQAPQVLPYLQTIPGVGFTSVLSTLLYMQGEQPAILLPQPLGGGPTDLTVASSVQNTNSPPFTSVVYAKPNGDATALGALNLENSGFGQFGDVNYQGQISVSGPSGKTTTITNDVVTTPVLNFTLGTISRIAAVSVNASTTATFFNHGLGVIPDLVILVIRQLGTGTTGVGYEASTMTTTQVKVQTVGTATTVGVEIISIAF